MKVYFAIFSSIFSITIAMIASESPVDCVTKVAEGVYAGYGKTEAGEQIFFGMEKIKSKNIKNWKLFKSSTENLVHHRLGPLVKLVKRAESTIFPSDYAFDSFKETTKLQEQIMQRAQELRKNRPATNPSKFARPLDELANQIVLIGHGVCAFFPSDGNWVVYASKVPVNGHFDFSSVSGKTELTLKEYKRAFKNILMAVVTYDFDAHLYEHYTNRGIFRNPFNFLEGTYNRISLILHGFSAAVVQHLRSDIKFMRVSPNSSMQRILFAALGDDDLFLEEWTREGKMEPVPFKQSYTYAEYIDNKIRGELSNIIKIEALVNIYKKCCERK